jgi:pyruvate kinase
MGECRIYRPMMKPRLRRTKIVATLGPASDKPEVLRALVAAGMDVARLNLSHGTHEGHAQTIARVRAIAQELDSPVTLLLDLQGPKVRVGQLAGGENPCFAIGTWWAPATRSSSSAAFRRARCAEETS